MVFGDFPKLWNSEYVSDDVPDNDDYGYILLPGAPPDIVELYERYKEIIDKEKRTGKHIF